MQLLLQPCVTVKFEDKHDSRNFRPEMLSNCKYCEYRKKRACDNSQYLHRLSSCKLEKQAAAYKRDSTVCEWLRSRGRPYHERP